MDIEQQITDRMKQYGDSRLETIASMNLGARSEAATRALRNRARRKELMNYGINFDTACAVVNQENNRDNE